MTIDPTRYTKAARGDEKKRTVSVQIPTELAERLDRAREESGFLVGEFVRAALDDALARLENA